MLTPQLADQVRRFKMGRARKGFLQNVRDARRFYLRGERTVSAQRWLEAARWLAPGPDRERVRHRAAEAARGVLRLDVEALAASALADRPEPAAHARTACAPGPPQCARPARPAPQAAGEAGRRRPRGRPGRPHRRLLILLGIFGFLLAVLLCILVAILR